MPNTLPQISFGTDGWRAIIAHEYTFENVQACALAVALELEATDQTHRGVAVGYDTRFQSQAFAQTAAQAIANRGIPVQLSDRPLPTPALSLAVTNMNAAAGVMITASHNPPEYNGFKVKSEAGGSAPPDQVERIESHLQSLPLADETSEAHLVPFAKRKGTRTSEASSQGMPGAEGNIQTTNMVSPYLDQLASLVDIDTIKSAGIKVAVDSMHGSGAGIIATLLEGGKTQVTEIRSEINPAFPGMKQPEPVDDNLHPLIDLISNQNFDVGLATDGDADRLGVVAENGTYLTTLEVFSMLFHHLKSRRNLPGGAACTITMSSMMDRLAEHHNTDLYRTPVGFKFVGPAMIDNACVLGGEESGGYAFAGHIPERDGPPKRPLLPRKHRQIRQNPNPTPSRDPPNHRPTHLPTHRHPIHPRPTRPHCKRPQRQRPHNPRQSNRPKSRPPRRPPPRPQRQRLGSSPPIRHRTPSPHLRRSTNQPTTRRHPKRLPRAFGRLDPFARRQEWDRQVPARTLIRGPSPEERGGGWKIPSTHRRSRGMVDARPRASFRSMWLRPCGSASHLPPEYSRDKTREGRSNSHPRGPAIHSQENRESNLTLI